MSENFNITYTGLGLEVTEAIKDHTFKKMNKLQHHADKISRINVTYNIEHHDKIAEATVHLPGNEFHARASHSDMYSAIDGLVAKLDKQLIRHKQKTITRSQKADDQTL